LGDLRRLPKQEGQHHGDIVFFFGLVLWFHPLNLAQMVDLCNREPGFYPNE
jgi:F420-0:gamma-glutamyl ligase-like protein